ncbi:MAG: hypothetical protein WA133_13230, partial [Syntrophales bacterium]
WLDRWPLVLRRTMQAKVAKARTEGRAQVADDLTRERQMLTEILGRLHQVEYRRVGQREYQMTVRFNPSIFDYGSVGREEQRYLAAMIARRVQEEIATSKFIKDANEREMREGPRYNMAGGFPDAR